MLMYPYIDVFLFYGLISELCHTGSVRVKTRDELHPAGVRGPAGPLSGQPPGARGSPPCALHLPPLRPAAVNRSPATANHTAPASGRQNSCCCSSRVRADNVVKSQRLALLSPDSDRRQTVCAILPGGH